MKDPMVRWIGGGILAFLLLCGIVAALNPKSPTGYSGIVGNIYPGIKLYADNPQRPGEKVQVGRVITAEGETVTVEIGGDVATGPRDDLLKSGLFVYNSDPVLRR